MCFSAEASFTVSAVLLITGVASIKKITAPSQIFFASIPIIFAIQQFSEGILWLALTRTSYAEWEAPATYVFLVFAQVVWPIWVPLSFLRIENQITRRKILWSLLVIGVSLSVYLTYCLLTYDVHAHISEHHIHLDLLFPHYLRWFSGLFYFLPTVISSFISSIKRTWIIGALTLASFIIATLFFKDYVLSVWCFLAAVISAVIVIVMQSPNKRNGTVQVKGKIV